MFYTCNCHTALHTFSWTSLRSVNRMTCKSKSRISRVWLQISKKGKRLQIHIQELLLLTPSFQSLCSYILLYIARRILRFQSSRNYWKIIHLLYIYSIFIRIYSFSKFSNKVLSINIKTFSKNMKIQLMRLYSKQKNNFYRCS